MKKLLTTLLFFTISNLLLSQEDWKLPINKGKIQFEFNSKKLNTGKKDLCEIYLSTNTQTDLTKHFTNIMLNGKHKLLSSAYFIFTYKLFGADATIGSMESFSPPNCKPGNDTLIGNLDINITRYQLMLGGIKFTSCNINCVYRIILKDDTYNIKIRGFKCTYVTKPKMLMPSERKTVPLEEIYDESKLSKSEKKFWADFKMLINLFNTTLENVLATQGSDFNFDD